MLICVSMVDFPKNKICCSSLMRVGWFLFLTLPLVGEISSDKLLPVVERDSASPLFEIIAPEISGLTAIDQYSDPRAWNLYWKQYYNASIGTGISLGDVNGDGWTDVFLVSKDSSNRLYLNRGESGFTFRDVTEESGTAGCEGFGAGSSFVDIDNDGDLDLYVCYTGSPNELYINDGSGVFPEQGKDWGVDINTGSHAPSFADFDKDGDMDLYLQCNYLESANSPEGMEDFLFQNMGNHFVDITTKAGISGIGQGNSAIWWDYNEDGDVDLYVANDYTQNDKLYRNNGDHTFTDVITEVLVSSPYFSMGSDIGDINNDGFMDLLITDMAARDHVKQQTTTATMSTYLMNISRSGISQYMKNMLNLNIGPKQFAEIANLAGVEATDWTWSPRFVDLDNDGWVDFYCTNGMKRVFHDSDLSNRIARAGSKQQGIRIYKTSPPLLEDNLASKNNGDLTFTPIGNEWGLDLNGISFAACFSDFDHDGDLDLIINNLDAPPTLYRNTSDNGHRLLLSLVGHESNHFGIGAKVSVFAGDTVQRRDLLLTRGYMSQDEPNVHFAFENTETVDRILIQWPSGTTQELFDVQTGYAYEIHEEETQVKPEVLGTTAALFVPSSIQIPYEARGDEEFYALYGKQPLVPFDESWNGPVLAVEDLDDDGWQDVILGGATGFETKVFRNVEGSSLELVESDTFFEDYDSEDADINTFDYNDDGLKDLIVLSGSFELDQHSPSFADRIYLQTDDLEYERLESEFFPSQPQPSRGLVLLDVNGDDREDMVIGGGTVKDRYPEAYENQVWLRTEEGYRLDTESSFAKSFAQSGKISEVMAIDLDVDGDLDLVQANEWGPPLIWICDASTLHQASDRFLGMNLSGIWRSITAGDFNGDGLPDLVFGNIGGNSKYRATADAPVVLFTREAGLGNLHLEAYTNQGRLLAIETRNILQKLFPREVGASSRTYREFASKTVEELFPNLDEDFSRHEIDCVQTQLFLQTAEGKFSQTPLPSLAQSGVAADLLADDVDGDGHDDIVIAFERLAPVPWVGRIHKGYLLLLKGKGDGSFETLTPWESGLETDAHPKRLVLTDLNGDEVPELLVSQNYGKLLIFELSK